MEEKLMVGSSFQDNHRLLTDSGWLQVFGDSCVARNSDNKEFAYVRGADPSFTLRLKYDGSCRLESTSLKKREVNEL